MNFRSVFLRRTDPECLDEDDAGNENGDERNEDHDGLNSNRRSDMAISMNPSA
jgi:hypothetical protein